MNLILDTEILQDYTGEPVSVSDAKAYMKVNFTDDDSLIESLIANAIRWLENYTGRSFKQRSMKYSVEMTAQEWYRLPEPVISVDAVNYEDETLALNHLTIAGPNIKVNFDGVFDIYFTTGYTTLPDDIRNDILAITAYTYQNRGIDLSNEGANLVDFPMLASQYYRRVPI